MPIKDINTLLTRLKSVKKISTGYIALCPAHRDTHQSLSIKADVDSKAVLYCHAGCTYKDILQALNLNGEMPLIPHVIEQTYDYVDMNGELIFQVVKYHPKDFRQRRPDGKGGWIWNLNSIEPVLYRLPELCAGIKDSMVVYIVEGEKDCDTLYLHGFIATTQAGGASAKWLPQYTETLKGAHIAIIPDKDEAGQQRALRLAKTLFGWVEGIRVLYLNAQDISDWFEKGHSAEELVVNFYAEAKEFVPSGEITRDDYFDLKGHLVHLHGKFNELSQRKQKPYPSKNILINK